LQGVYRYFYKKLIRPIFTIRSSPHSIALGMAFGLFVALTPTVGFQMILVAVIGTLIKANRIIALVVVWISNPLTFIPMYYGYYYLGGAILGVDLWTFDNFSLKFNQFLSTGEDQGYSALAREFGSEIFYPLWVGSLIIALVAAIPAYPLTRFAVRRARLKKKAMWTEARARHAEKKRAARDDAGGDGTATESSDGGSKKEAKASEKQKLTVLLIATLCAVSLAACSPGSESARDGDGAPKDSFDTPQADTMHVATLGLESRHPLFVEFAHFGIAREHYAFLRIYNFSDRPYSPGEVKKALTIEAGSDRRQLKPIEDFRQDDRSRTLELLALASPQDGVDPWHWARIPLAYEGSPLSLENVKIRIASEKGDTLMALREVQSADWGRFVRDPSLETLSRLRDSTRN